jgi:3-methyladenine DNA glycosylase AlkD
MNVYHRDILNEIQKKRKKQNSFHTSEGYSGSSHVSYGLVSAESKAIAKNWAQKHKDVSLVQFFALLDSLYKGESSEEKRMGGLLFQYFPKLRSRVSPAHLKKWLWDLEGWAEIDSLCQSVFTAKDMDSQWNEWQKVIKEFSSSTYISHRRASLVLLTAPVRKSNDKKFAHLAFRNIEKLKDERGILVTKAISWLLREMIKYHKKEVEEYVEQNKDSLPGIAVRETIKKLKTGKK